MHWIWGIGVLGRIPGRNFESLICRYNSIYLILLLISFNHVNNVMAVYTHSNQKDFIFLALLIWSTTASNEGWMSLWICSIAKVDSLSCPIVARKYVFTCFKTLNDLSAVGVDGSIKAKFSIYNRYLDTSSNVTQRRTRIQVELIASLQATFSLMSKLNTESWNPTLRHCGQKYSWKNNRFTSFD
jgi:hypothetical protein